MRSARCCHQTDRQRKWSLVDAFNFNPRRKAAVARAQRPLGGRRTTLVIDDGDVNTYLSFRNIPTVNILPVSAANTWLIDNKARVRPTP